MLWMKAQDHSTSACAGVSVKDPEWSHLESKVRSAFGFGGQVILSSVEAGSGGQVQTRAMLGMEAHPGECRLIYTPDELPSDKTGRREWWEPGDSEFRGTTIFNDHPWDDRTVCRDVSVAISLFRDFFVHEDLSDMGISQTRSVWDRKPR